MKFIGKSGKTIVEHLQDMLNDPALFAEMTGYQTDAVREAIKTLAKDNNVPVKQPDPITGLVPCGCGAIAKVRKSQAPYSGYYIVCQNINCICNVGFDRDTSGVPLGYFKTEEEAIKAWNTAMSGGMCNHEN